MEPTHSPPKQEAIGKLSGVIPAAVEKNGLRKQEVMCLVKGIHRLLDHALGHLSHNKLAVFDAQVRDTSCQVRAGRIVTMAEGGVITTKQTRIRANLQTIGRWQKKLTKQKYGSLAQVMEEQQVDLDLDEPTLFLLLSYLLGVVKQRHGTTGKAYTCPGALSQYMKGAPKGAWRQIVDEAQRQLAALSVNHMRKEAAAIREDSLVAKLAKEVLTTSPAIDDGHGRKLLPALYTLATVCLRAQENKQPLALVVHQVRNQVSLGKNAGRIGTVKIFMVPKRGLYEEVDPSTLETMQPALVVEAVSTHTGSVESLKKAILQHNVIDLILMNGAAHPQGAGENRDVSIAHEAGQKELERLAALAKKLGCCRANPSLLCVMHIWAERVRNLTK